MAIDPHKRFRKRWLFLLDPLAIVAGTDATGKSIVTVAGSFILDPCDIAVVNSQNWLVTYPTADATVTNNWIGGEPSFEFAGNGVSVHPGSRQMNAKVHMTECRRGVYRALRYLNNLSESTQYGQSFVPLTLLDYLYPEDQDETVAMLAGTEPVTVRRGMVKLEAKGMVGNDSDLQFVFGGFDCGWISSELRRGQL